MLDRENNLFFVKIKNYVLEETDAKSNYNYLRFLSFLGAPAGFIFMEASCKFAGNNPGLCFFFMSATVLSYGLGAMWMINRLIEKNFLMVNDDIFIINPKTNYKSLYYLAKTLMHFLSLIATIVPVYISYKFSNNKKIIFVAIPIAYSFNYFSFCELFNINHYNKIKKTLFTLIGNNYLIVGNGLREEFIKKVEYISMYVLNSNIEDKLNIIKDVEKITTPSETISYTMNFVESERLTSTNKNNVFIICKVLFLIFPITNVFINIELGYGAISHFIKNSLATNFIIFLIALSNFVMDLFFSQKIIGDLCSNIEHKLKTKMYTSYLESKSPLVYYLVSIFLIVLAASSSTGRAYIANQTLSSRLTSFIYALNAFFYEFFTQADIANSISCCCFFANSNDEKKIISIYTKIRKLNIIAEETSDDAVELALTDYFTESQQRITSDQINFFSKEPDESFNALHCTTMN